MLRQVADMNQIETITSSYDQLSGELQQQACRYHFLLIDLAGSTAFKTENPELTWVTRLETFYSLVSSLLNEAAYFKFLGDGVFASYPADAFSADKILEVSNAILQHIKDANGSGKFNPMIARLVLNTGVAFPLKGSDPHGTAVDKLFRLEKRVPDGAIGMTAEFVEQLSSPNAIEVGSVYLKGLGTEPHSLWIDKIFEPSANRLEELRTESSAAAIWLLSGSNAEPIHLIGGFIPPEEQQTYSVVQLGDRDASVQALYNLAAYCSVQQVRLFTSLDFSDDKLTGNVVCVGGPCFNRITRRFMEEANLPLGFEDIDGDEDLTPLVNRRTNTVFNKELDGSGRLIRDWGLFARFRNPFNESNRVIIACGIESSAVSGIVQLLTPSANPSFVRFVNALPKDDSGQLADFCCAVPFSVNPLTGVPNIPALRYQIGEVLELQID